MQLYAIKVLTNFTIKKFIIPLKDYVIMYQLFNEAMIIFKIYQFENLIMD